MKVNKVMSAILSLMLVATCGAVAVDPVFADYKDGIDAYTYKDYEIPAYDGDLVEVVNDDDPEFSEDELIPEASETYGALDNLGRATECEAVLNQSLMPNYKRDSDMSKFKPTGWRNKSYSFISGSWLYNRCHLIGFQLTGVDSSNKSQYLMQNLITGTRYLNVENGNGGMLEFENIAASYIKEDGDNYLAYRVTPVYEGDNLVANGVLIEAESIEDTLTEDNDEGDVDGEDIDFSDYLEVDDSESEVISSDDSATDTDSKDVEFCVFVYNVQPGILIDYETGDNKLNGKELTSENTKVTLSKTSYTYTGKALKPDVTVAYTDDEGTTITLEEGADYTLTYSKNTNVGTANVTVEGSGSAGAYFGKITKTFKINPVKTSIKSLTKARKAFTVKWTKKTTQVSGYQIQYSTSSKFTKSTTKSSLVTTYKTGSRKIKNLKAKKNYYVRIRTYKSVNGTKYYSGWSTTKKVKTK